MKKTISKLNAIKVRWWYRAKLLRTSYIEFPQLGEEDSGSKVTANEAAEILRMKFDQGGNLI